MKPAALLLLAAVACRGRFEQSFNASREYAHPLQDLQAAVEFAGPGGARMEVPAFWDGGRTWRVRFTAPAAGAWKYRVRSSDPALNRRTGAFTAPAAGGWLRLSADRRYLVRPDGTPWFWLADTAWNGALLSTRGEWERYLADRAAKKFTAIQFVATQWRAGRHDERGQAAFTSGERLEINPAFYQRLDERIDAINAHGLVAAPVLLWALTSKDNESPGVALSTAQAIELAAYMVARYGAHDVVWILGGDGDYRGAHAARWKAIGRAVFPPGRPHAPVTMHPRGMQSPWAEYVNEPWVDLFLYQSGHGSSAAKWRWNATQGGAVDWKLEPAHPVIDAEINYEGHLDYQNRQPITDAQVRRAAYYSLLAAPPAGVTYGAHGIWYWSREPAVPLDHPATGAARPWFECLDYPGARQMKVLREVFDSLAWWKLRPERTLLAVDPPDPYLMPAMAGSEFALVYLPGNPAVELNLTPFGRQVQGAWIDPRNGRRSDAGLWDPKPAVRVATPGPGDWLLLLK